VRIAVPDAPRDGSVSRCKLFEHRDAIRRRHVQPAVDGREKDTEEPGSRQISRKLLRQAAGCLDGVALRNDARVEGSGDREQVGTAGSIVHRFLPCLDDIWASMTSEPRSPSAIAGRPLR
jgi:hypothetical protein